MHTDKLCTHSHDVNVRAYEIAFLFYLLLNTDRYEADYCLCVSTVRSTQDLGLQEILVSKHTVVQALKMQSSLLAVDTMHKL